MEIFIKEGKEYIVKVKTIQIKNMKVSIVVEKGTKIPTIHAIKNKVNVILSFLCLLFWNIRPLIKLFDKIPKRGLSKQRMLKMKNI